MRLRRIEVENFKGIGQCQVIDLKPITLLFGPNSAGKTTILQALHYLREILERRNINPDVTIAGGLTDLGGFPTLVHNYELDRPVRIKVTLDLDGDEGIDEDLPLNSGIHRGDPEFLELPIRYLLGDSTEFKDNALVMEIALEVELRWSDLEHAAYVSRLGVELDGKHLVEIVSPPQEGRALLTDFDFAHPLLRRLIEPDADDGGEDSSPLEDEIWSLAREVALDLSMPDTPEDKLRIAVDTECGALPDLDRELKLDIRDPDVKKVELEEHTPRAIGLRRLLSEIVLGPARLVRDYLGEMTYIGPLREIPTRSYRPQATPDEARWAHGLAAWDLLYGDRRGELVNEVNAWISDEKRLNTGYRLELVEFKEVPIPSVFHQFFERGLNGDDIDELQELYGDLKMRKRIALRDVDKGIIVAPSDVGVGISQMVPVVVSALRNQHGVLAIEQPELHVHPAIQVGIGDLFIYAVRPDPDRLLDDKTLLVETHSEHIILRLLRRIREMTEHELPPGTLGLEAENLAVVYVENRDDGVRFRPLAIDKDGEFVDRWPQGFFEERAGELF